MEMERSNGYNPFRYIRSETDIVKLITNLIANTTPKNSSSNDPFWEKAESLYLQAIFLYVWMECPPKERNFRMVLKLLNEAEVHADGSPSDLDRRFRRLERKKGSSHPAIIQYNKPIKSTLSKALDYIENPDKTDGKMLVSSFGCSYETADIEFEYTLSQALQKGNNLAFHLIQSFEPGEVDYQKAHEIGKQLADAVTKGQHEYVLTTHIDKGHVHNHIIFCAVNFVDHRKYNSNKRSYYGIRNMSDKLCRENGLSVVVPGKGSKGKSYAEYQAEKTGTSWKGKLKIAVDALIPQVSSFPSVWETSKTDTTL
mgnify:CR=1 FL=1